MTPTGRVDMSEFDATLKKYLSITPQVIPKALNNKALRVALAAYRATVRASRSAIEALGVTSTTVGKRGQALRRRKNTYDTTGRARAIYIAKLRREGRLSTAADVNKGVRKMLASRLRAVGSLAAGWIGCIRAFIRATRESADTSGPRVKQRGIGLPAKEGWNAKAELIYGLTVDSRTNPHVDPRVETALVQAFNAETADMKEYIERKIGKAWEAIK
jgi:hypothetical protein